MSTIPMDKLPPQSLEAEQAVLGAMMLDKEAIDRATAILSPDDFYSDRNRIVYAAILDLYAKEIPADLVTVAEVLRVRQQLTTVGGTLMLTEAMAAVPTAAGIAQYARIVKDKAQRRRLIRAADHIQHMAYVETNPLDDIYDQAEQSILAVNQRRVHDGPHSIGEYANRVYRGYVQDITDGVGRGFRTGWHSVNHILNPVMPGQLVIIAARPGMGKTAYAMQWGIDLAYQDCPGVMFSMEMEGEELAMRSMLAHMQTSASELHDLGYCTENKDRVIADLEQAATRFVDCSIVIDDRANLSPLEMRSVLRRVRKRQRVDWVMVDFLQLAKPAGKHENRAEAIGQLAYDMAGMAKDLDLTVIAMSQLNRSVEAESPRRPQMNHLLESGKIEAAAHRIISLYRPGRYGEEEVEEAGYPSDMEDLTEVGILKQRSGRGNGRALVMFDGPRYTFRDLSPGEKARLA